MAGVGTAALVLGGMGLVGGAISAGKASDASDRASAQQAQMAAADLGFRQQVYADQKAKEAENEAYTKPIRSFFLKQAMGPDNTFYNENQGNIKQGYVNANVGLKENLARTGMTDSGLGAAAEQSMQISQARDLSRAWMQGKQQKLALAGQLLGMAPNPGNVMGAAQMVGQGYGNLAGMYGQQAGMYGQAAAQAWAGAGQSLNNAGMMYALGHK